jgi:hypothetical protein
MPSFPANSGKQKTPRSLNLSVACLS